METFSVFLSVPLELARTVKNTLNSSTNVAKNLQTHI